MSGFASIRRVLADYRAEFGLSHLALAVEFALLTGSIALLASGGWAFSAMTP